MKGLEAVQFVGELGIALRRSAVNGFSGENVGAVKHSWLLCFYVFMRPSENVSDGLLL
ncbi:hypothetical protein NEIFLAOT_00659 [Neisseria flavescens NRL30031/H210]|uniref:Uncharacterized protein n=1 Tax=Neisseria flavescens NRL30031/H210 TaxID=546264 RepID=C0EL53_NEIFL|nr:hypothetical protein NEIFLAOT_00659 [Neisseria flavescens NRL30031/H210]